MKKPKIIYEVIAWTDAENQGMPDSMKRFRTKREAMQFAKTIAARFGRTEVNLLKVNPEDEGDLWECYLAASWTNA